MAEEDVGYKKPPKSGQFVKGDKRINRKGRPKNFDKLRKLAQAVASEEARLKDGSPSGITHIEAILRALATSKAPADRKLFLEVAYGKVPDEQIAEVTHRIKVEYVNAYQDDGDQDG